MSVPLSANTPLPARYPTLPGASQRAASLSDAKRAAGIELTREYEQLRLHLVALNASLEPDMVAIDHAIDRLAQLQLDIKASQGLIGNNPNDE